MPKNNTIKLILAFLVGFLVAHFWHGGTLTSKGAGSNG